MHNNERVELDELRRSIEELGKSLDEVKKTTTILSEKIDKLNKSLVELSREVGKISDSLGFMVEDLARSLLPAWLRANLNLVVKDLNRAFFNTNDRVVEVDLYGYAIDLAGNPVILLGEAKTRLHGEDVRAFYEKINQIIEKGDNQRYLIIMFGLYVHPSAIQEAVNRGVIVISPYTTVLQGKVVQILQNTL